MRVDAVEASWDAAKKQWLLRIRVGEEVVRRYCSIPKDAQEQALKSATQKALEDEGYESDPGELKIRR